MFSGIVGAYVEPRDQYIAVAIPMVYVFFKFQNGSIFLKYNFSFSDVIFSPLVKSLVELKIFTTSYGMYDVSVHVTG